VSNYGTPTTNTFNSSLYSTLNTTSAIGLVLLGIGIAEQSLSGQSVTKGPQAPLSNSPFAIARSSNPLITDGQDAKIVRGYIRRDALSSDPTSKYRLNFMYNPGSIQRSYISYLDQGALDPYNTIYQAGNLVTPPGILDFSFELLFDRQIEAGDPSNKGCGEDYDYFERVIRGVEPQATASVNTIPDNGVLLVNPQTITVVFSEHLQVQGKVSNAVVSYDRFNHRMIPTRMSVGIQMKVTYIGDGLPQGQPFDLHIEQATSSSTATVPYDNQVSVNVKHSEDADAAIGQGQANKILESFGLDWGGTSTATGGYGVGGNDGGAAQAAGTTAPSGPVNIVTVRGIQVAQSVAVQVGNMVDAAAAAGIKLTGGGYRSKAEQIKLRGQHGCGGADVMNPKCKCNPPTAIPGTSQHEVGLAIDFTGCNHGTAIFNWLSSNAARFGYKNLPSESWHWSTTGT
jgi:hypothetical protein